MEIIDRDRSKIKSTFYYLKNLLKFLSLKRKSQLLFTLFLMILTSIFELFSLASLIPFISVLINPEQVLEIKALRLFFNLFGVTTSNEIIIIWYKFC